MIDPHVESLYYRLEPKPGVLYENAPPIEYDATAFSVILAKDEAVFKLKAHCASEAEALQLIQPFVEKWEVASGLEKGPDRFKLAYDRASVVDRSPTPNVVAASGKATGRSKASAVGVEVHTLYPRPPTDFAVSPLVTAMYYQYQGLHEGKLAIGHVAYFCSTIIRDNGGSTYFSISNTVLKKMQRLSTEKGGKEARKAMGLNTELSAYERRWLQEAIKMTIRRAAERAAQPNAALPRITMSDLPTLE